MKKAGWSFSNIYAFVCVTSISFFFCCFCLFTNVFFWHSVLYLCFYHSERYAFLINLLCFLNLIGVMIKWTQIFQSRTITELILVFCLDHCRTLCTQNTHSLEDIQHTLILHSFQHDAECDENTGASDPGAAMDL